MNEQQQAAMMGTQQPVDLTLQDISTVVQIIDAVSRRGGFEGQELAGVGALRNKIVAYVNQRTPVPDPTAEADVVEGDVPPDAPLADKVQ
jgi:hypothetical protein